ncbi:MAG TPA: NAD-dependent epimerase/dehydratase family protein, partial [Methylomirabilota bacterium]
MAARRVLVTGMSGLIGTALRTHVEGTYALRALNRRPVPGVETHQADLGDLDAITPAFAGVHTVVHLAAAAGDNQLPADIMRSNVAGAYNVFEAARLAGVTRVIFASSGATVSGWEREPPLSHLVAGRYDQLGEWKPLTHESPLRPSGLYGASKIWGEALARHYADAYGMS